jgi:hypothetical protein
MFKSVNKNATHSGDSKNVIAMEERHIIKHGN